MVAPAGIARPGTAKALVLLAMANLRRERLRSGLLLLTIALATLLFITALGSLSGVREPVTDMLQRQNASHALLNFDARVYDASDIFNWWKNQDGVESVTPLLPYVDTDGRPVFDGIPLSDALKLTERPAALMSQDLLDFQDGDEKSYPGPGEIWLPTNVAEAAGMSIGDVLEIATDQGARPYTLSGIVVDPQYSSGFMNPIRAWVGPGELPAIYTPRQLNSYTLGIRAQQPQQLDELWRKFDQRFEGGFAGGYIPYEQIVGSYANLVQMLSMMVLTFGVISLLVALFIISSTIKGEILANYRTFGVLKSMGYTPGNIVLTFQLQFLLLCLLAIPIGIVGGFFATRALISLMLSSIGTMQAELSFALPALVTMFLLLALVSAAAGLAGGRAGRIKAASSIRYGAPEESLKSRALVHLRLARILPLSLVIGLKNLASGKRRELYDLVTVAATSFVLLFSINLFYSMTMTGKNLPFWGFDGSDVSVNVQKGFLAMRYAPLKEFLGGKPEVQAFGGLAIDNAITIPPQGERAALSVSGHIVDGDLDQLGFINLQGRNPRLKGEISLGVNLARDYGWAIGDTIAADVYGQKRSFKVTAVFQGSSSRGYWYRVTMDSVLDVDPNFTPDQIGLVLNDDADRQTFMDDLEAQLGETIDVEPSEKFIESQLNTVVTAIGAVVTFLSAVFLTVSAVSIFNSTTMGIHETKRQLGVYKALGYTQRQIRLILVNKSAVIGVISVAAGLVAFYLLAGPIMSLLTSGMGMPEFPMMVNKGRSVLVVPVVITLCMVSAWLPSNAISRIKARTLIVE